MHSILVPLSYLFSELASTHTYPSNRRGTLLRIPIMNTKQASITNLQAGFTGDLLCDSLSRRVVHEKQGTCYSGVQWCTNLAMIGGRGVFSFYHNLCTIIFQCKRQKLRFEDKLRFGNSAFVNYHNNNWNYNLFCKYLYLFVSAPNAPSCFKAEMSLTKNMSLTNVCDNIDN